MRTCKNELCGNREERRNAKYCPRCGDEFSSWRKSARILGGFFRYYGEPIREGLHGLKGGSVLALSGLKRSFGVVSKVIERKWNSADQDARDCVSFFSVICGVPSLILISTGLGLYLANGCQPPESQLSHRESRIYQFYEEHGLDRQGLHYWDYVEHVGLESSGDTEILE